MSGPPTGTQFTGTLLLLRHAIRLDRWKLLPWLLIFGAIPTATYAAYGAIFTSPAEALLLQATLSTNPAFALLFGPATDLTTAIGFVTWRMQMFSMFFVSLMAVYAVTRHTRAAEDSGQAELVDSGVVGQHARLASAVLLAWLASATVGLLVGGALASAGAPPSDAFALGALLAGMGVAFAGIAAVTAQLGSVARTANTLAVSVLGISYLLRGLGDTLADAGWLLWTNPMGWAERIRPAADNNFWPLALLVGAGAILTVVAAWLRSRRDFGLGIIPGRPGPAQGRAGIWGLTSRLDRGAFWTWGVSLVALGSVYGLVTSTMASVFADNPFIKQMIAFRVATEEQLLMAFVGVLLLVLTLISGAFGIHLALHFYAEEEERRAEWVLSAPLSRLGYFTPTAVLAIVAPAAGLMAGALALAAGAKATGSAADTVTVLQQALAQLPALWLATAVALALVGLAPRLRGLAWLLLVYWLLLTMFGPVLKLPDWLLNTSPFHVVPNVSAPDADWLPVWWTLAIAAVLLVSALAGYRRRDLVCT